MGTVDHRHPQGALPPRSDARHRSAQAWANGHDHRVSSHPHPLPKPSTKRRWQHDQHSCSPDLIALGACSSRLPGPSRARVDSQLRLISALDFKIELFAKLVADRLRTHPGYTAIRVIPGVGPILAAVFVAEIGDITRFGGPEQLASWAGLTP